MKILIMSFHYNLCSVVSIVAILCLVYVPTYGFQEPSSNDCNRFVYEHQIMERLIKLELENTNLKERVKELETRNTPQRVVVKLGLSANQDLTQNPRVMFNVEMWNEGGAYDLDTGEFVTPISGVYMIAVHACLTAPRWMDLDIIKDGAIVGRVFSGDKSYHNCGSETSAIHLERGDKIWVVRVAGTATVLNQEHGKNTFTAALIMQD